MSKKRPRVRGVKGYRLHARRLEYTGKSGAIRTIKYPLYSSPTGKEKSVPSEVVEAINHDYIGLYGLTNFDDLDNVEKRNEKVYSVLDFWYDCVCYGAVFSYKPDRLKEHIAKIFGEKSFFEEILKQSPYYPYLEANQTIDFLTTPSRKAVFEKLHEKIKLCFQESRRERFSDECSQLAQEIVKTKGKEAEQEGLKFKFFKIFKPESAKTFSLTCCLLPCFPVEGEQKERGEVLRERIKYCSEKLNQDMVTPNKKGEEKFNKKTCEYIGIEGNGNALSHFLGIFTARLRRDEIQKLKEEMMNATDAWLGKEEDLENRLLALAARAKKLWEPKFGNHWADYRSDINGKLSTWLQGYMRQKFTIIHDLEKHIRDWDEALKIISNSQFTDTEGEKENFSKLKELAEKAVEENGVGSSLNTYRALFGDSKTRLNRFIQRDDVQEMLKDEEKRKKKGGVEEESETIDFKKVFPALSKPLKLVPNFYGESKREAYKKYENAARYTNALWQAIEKLYESAFSSPVKLAFSDEDFFLKRLQKIFSIYRRFNTDRWKPIVENALAPYYNIAALAEGEVLYKPKQSRNRKVTAINPNRLMNLPPASENIAGKGLALARELSRAGFDWKAILKEGRCEEYIDLIELHKTALALVLSVTDTQFNVREVDFCGNPTVEDFKNAQDKNAHGLLQGRLLEMFSQSILFSELRGLAGLMSRKEFITRSAIQTINGKQAELLYIPREMPTQNFTVPKDMERAFLARPPLNFISSLEPKSLSEKLTYKLKQLRYYPHYFAYELTLEGQGLDDETARWALRFKKSGENKRIQCDLYKKQNGIVLYVRSSHYQTQFLEWLLHRPSHVKTDVAIAGSFLIAEKNVKARWDYDALKVAIEPVPCSKRNPEPERVFVSQPFTIFPEKSAEEAGKRYLGIDIGEYGIAYTAIKIIRENEVKILEQGFIPDPQLKALREEVKGLKLDQRRGTFAMPSTKIARIRESIAHGLRNRIHHLALKHRAKIVYEWEVSRFEEGKQKIKKVYATLKKSDVIPKNDADRDFKDAVWGKLIKKDGITIAQEIGASWTSQFCSACKTLWRAEIKYDETDKNKKLTGSIKKPDVPILTLSIETNEGETEINGYSKTAFKDGHVLTGGDLTDIIKGFMRPPIGDESVVYQKFCKDKALFDPKLKETRGNSWLFICPFCHANADADIQASQTIALLEYVRDVRGIDDYYERYREIKNFTIAKLDE